MIGMVLNFISIHYISMKKVLDCIPYETSSLWQTDVPVNVKDWLIWQQQFQLQFSFYLKIISLHLRTKLKTSQYICTCMGYIDYKILEKYTLYFFSQIQHTSQNRIPLFISLYLLLLLLIIQVDFKMWQNT